MLPAHDACYAALCAHDRRFDGRFFVGVTSTGIYCRPVCTARTPKSENCRFFSNAAAAEAAGFRPCLRCRPELAPGYAPIDAASRLAWAAAQRIEAGEEASLTTLAERLGVTSRHLRRVFRQEFGVSPTAFGQTQRLLLAKRFLADTKLPIGEIAYAVGFASLRRFNALFRERYALAPSDFRREAARDNSCAPIFELAYRPPFDWTRLLAFLAGRRIAGVEVVEEACYRRSVRCATPDGERLGVLTVSHRPERCAIAVHVSAELLYGLPAILASVRRLFDLACEPEAVDTVLGALADDAPGLRVPGAFDGFEMAVRGILGQQITVKAAHTLAGRVVARFGTALPQAQGGVTHAFPSAARFADVEPEQLGELGIVRQRAGAILALAREVAAGRIELSPAADVPATLAALEALPGIGRWTAQYIALRALAWPDAWPSGDVALIKALGVAKAREADAFAERWSPWRSYAVLHLWRRLWEGRIGFAAGVEAGL
ncbi:MAG: DNA-3-methyladenine glycosylase 2 [Betaproteobacteria bacterium]|nr:DNA-3-methyladenine glycosylase 2 [Betaproteobacteria bacterium]